jgi:hypothetical protein
MITAVNNQLNIAFVQALWEQQSVKRDPISAKKSFKADDRVNISDQARERLQAQHNDNSVIKDEKNLAEEEKRQADKLKKTDQEVRAHEKAHMAAGSGLVMGGANYEYERGPDGKMYAVGGEVKIDTSKERDPEATIRKMQKVKRAALAPAQPSGQDRSVAAKASQVETEARIELQKERSQAPREGNDQQEISPNNTYTNPFKSSNSSPQTGHNLNIVI